MKMCAHLWSQIDVVVVGLQKHTVSASSSTTPPIMDDPPRSNLFSSRSRAEDVALSSAETGSDKLKITSLTLDKA